MKECREEVARAPRKKAGAKEQPDTGREEIKRRTVRCLSALNEHELEALLADEEANVVH